MSNNPNINTNYNYSPLLYSEVNSEPKAKAKSSFCPQRDNDLPLTPTKQKTSLFYSSGHSKGYLSRELQSSNFSRYNNNDTYNYNILTSNHASDSSINNNINSVYSPFVIKKSSENYSNPDSQININNLNNSFSLNKSIFNKNYFSPESQNTLPNRKFYTPSPNTVRNEMLSDRFIPMNKGLNLLEKFELTTIYDCKKNSNNSSKLNMHLSQSAYSENLEEEEKINKQASIYNNLLQSNFFGFDHNPEDVVLKNLGKSSNMSMDIDSFSKSDASSRGSIKSKIFKFKSEKKRKKSHVGLTYNTNLKTSLGPIFNSIPNTSNTRSINSLRKIPNRPYKIIEAPRLIDDFYLNLLDWSSKNDIAVGLDNSVYLWSATKSHMINLFTYEEEKYVSGLIWNQNGTELSVGNSEGVVEIWDSMKFSIFIYLSINI